MTARPWRELAAASLLHAALIGIGTMTLPALMAGAAQEPGFSLAGLSRAWALIPLASAPGAMAAGPLIRRLGLRRCGLLFGLTGAAALAARALAPGNIWFGVTALGFGGATGGLLVVLTSAIAGRLPARRQGLVQSLFFAAYALGAACGLGGAGMLSGLLGGWRGLDLAAGLFAAICAGLWAWALDPRARPADPPPARPRRRPGRALMSHALTGYALAYGAFVGGYLGLSGMLPSQLRRLGWPGQRADLSAAAASLAFLAGAVTLAALTDRFGRRRLVFSMAMLAMALGTSAILPLAARGQAAPAIAAITTTGFAAGAMAVFMALLATDPHTGGASAAHSVSIATTASYIGGFAVPLLASLPPPSRAQWDFLGFSLCFLLAGAAIAATGVARGAAGD